MAKINIGRIAGSVIIVSSSEPTMRNDDKTNLLPGDIWINDATGDYYNFSTQWDKKGNLIGQRGATGEKGDTGLCALVLKEESVFSDSTKIQVGQENSSDILRFNRTPIVNDTFIMVAIDGSTNETYLCVCTVLSIISHTNDDGEIVSNAFYKIISSTSIKGAKGEPGNDALACGYGLEIDPSEAIISSTERTISAYSNYFNRKPIVGDSFFMFGYNEDIPFSCILSCKITSVNEEEATVGYITLGFLPTTGLMGPQGPKGEVGEQGPQGETGPQGATGTNGKTPTLEIINGELIAKYN